MKSSNISIFQTLYDVAENVKNTKESLRLKTLLQALEGVHDTLQDNVTCLPLKPSLEVNGIQVKTCSYFPSNTLPLKISFKTVEKNIIPAIFKVSKPVKYYVNLYISNYSAQTVSSSRLEMIYNKIC